MSRADLRDGWNRRYNTRRGASVRWHYWVGLYALCGDRSHEAGGPRVDSPPGPLCWLCKKAAPSRGAS